MRRLPVYILIDTSGSMRGEPIEAVKVGLDSMVSSLRTDPYALETVNISIITFDKDVKQLIPLTPIDSLQIPVITTPESGPTNTGAALKLLCSNVDKEVHLSTPEQKGDWMPLLFLMTDGRPSDIKLFNDTIPEIKKKHFADIIACAAGPHAKVEPLKALTDKLFSLDTMDSATFIKFFKWVSDSIGVGGRSGGSTGDTGMELPPPPAEVNVVI